MRRKDREITDISELDKIIKQCKVCRIGFVDNDEVYVVPMNFGYDYVNGKLELYFHSAKEGRKINILKQGNVKVGVEMDCEHKLKEGEIACMYGFSFASIIGNGRADVVCDANEKADMLNKIMLHQTDRDFSIDEKSYEAVLIFKIVIDNYTGKRSR